MRFMKPFFLISSIIHIFLWSGCAQKPQSLWQEGRISVMADEEDWEGIQGALRSTFEKVVRTPQIEYQFKLHHVPDSSFNLFSRAHFLILAGTLNSTGETGEIVQKMIREPELRKSIERGENFVFVKDNSWARDQIMMILVSKDIPTLRDKIEAHSIMLYDLIRNEEKQYLTDEVLKNRENESLSTQLMDRYSWTMRLQRDYFMGESFPEDNFLWMRRVMPDRWIFVRWVDGGESSLLNQDWVVRERNRIGQSYYRDYAEKVSDKYLFSRETTFKGRPALITTGLWERIDDTAGGPFKNYTFYDAPTERVYMIDIGLFAPGKEKLPYLKRIEVMVETFRTRFDMTPQ